MDPIQYFNNLADKVLENPELLELVATAESSEEIYDILFSFGYVDKDYMDYLLLSLDARDMLMHYLDPETGELSIDVVKHKN